MYFSSRVCVMIVSCLTAPDYYCSFHGQTTREKIFLKLLGYKCNPLGEENAVEIEKNSENSFLLRIGSQTKTIL